MIRNVGVKPTVFMTETAVTSVTASSATSAAAMKPYVVATVVDPAEVWRVALEMCTDLLSYCTLYLSDVVISCPLSSVKFFTFPDSVKKYSPIISEVAATFS